MSNLAKNIFRKILRKTLLGLNGKVTTFLIYTTCPIDFQEQMNIMSAYLDTHLRKLN